MKVRKKYIKEMQRLSEKRRAQDGFYVKPNEIVRLESDNDFAKSEPENICSYYDPLTTSEKVRHTMDWMACDPPQAHVPHKREKCPECGRRVKLRITFCHDGCCVYYRMPRHKKKNWFKKPKKGSKDTRQKRTSVVR